MSLNIRVDRVQAVLLADGWHEVLSKSFTIDDFEFADEFHSPLYRGLSGFNFTSPTGVFAGPSESILAVRHKP